MVVCLAVTLLRSSGVVDGPVDYLFGVPILLPYIKGISEKIERVCKHLGV